MFDAANINFAVYEDAKEYIGMASATMPDLGYITQSHSASGIAGNIEDVILGHIEAMTLGLNFKTISDNAVSMAAPRYHNIDMRVAQQEEDPVSGKIVVNAVKHVMRVIPKKISGGTVAPASAGDVSGEYAVRYWKMTVNGEVRVEVDPLNFVCNIDGTDYLEPVRKALGK